MVFYFEVMASLGIEDGGVGVGIYELSFTGRCGEGEVVDLVAELLG